MRRDVNFPKGVEVQRALRGRSGRARGLHAIPRHLLRALHFCLCKPRARAYPSRAVILLLSFLLSFPVSPQFLFEAARTVEGFSPLAKFFSDKNRQRGNLGTGLLPPPPPQELFTRENSRDSRCFYGSIAILSLYNNDEKRNLMKLNFQN